MVHLQAFTFNAFAENTFLLWDNHKQGTIIDPGCYDKEEIETLADFITQENIQIKQIVATHCHVDHVLGVSALKHKYRVPYIIPEKEKSVLQAVKVYAPMYGFHLYQEAEADAYFDGTQEIWVGNEKGKILQVPGHSPGHVAFYFEKEKFVIGGDVLFRESIGRTDLPGGSFDVLINSIHQQLFVLPDDVVVYPGHGPATTIDYEKKYNPFCAIRS